MLLGVVVLGAGCSSDPVPASGDVVIETTADATNAPEIVGTLRVVEGSDVLGCESATTVRTATPDDAEGRVVDIFTATCETGSRDGTFDITFVSETEESGTWEVSGATEDFADLTGSGSFTVDYSEQDSPASLTGSVSYPE